MKPAKFFFNRFGDFSWNWSGFRQCRPITSAIWRRKPGAELYSISEIDAVLKAYNKFLSDAKYIILSLTREFDIIPCDFQYGSCNRSNMAAQNRKYLYIWNYDRQRRNADVKSGVFDYDKLKKVFSSDRDNDRLLYTIIVLFSVTHCQCTCRPISATEVPNNIYLFLSQ